MTRIITVTSGKGGVGKTTITANIGSALALMGKKVCLIDADFGLNNLDIPLGLSNRIVFDILQVCTGYCSVEQAMVKDKHFSSLYFIPGSRNRLEQICDEQIFQQVVSRIAANHNFDYILIDSPAGIESGFKEAVSAAKEAVVVVTPDRTSVQDADRVIGLIERQLEVEPYIVINRYREACESEYRVDIDYILSILTSNLLGIVLEDEEVIKSVQFGKVMAINPNLENGLRLRQITRNLLNHTFDDFVRDNSAVQQSKLNQRLNPLMKSRRANRKMDQGKKRTSFLLR
ncbi:septum site-determining protein MinD [Paenibacillus sp. HB172176]|uniref:septum site-determining protein MinD n=1 Tax=Paenibacillus sp. HB172176 TaxID=2493690 RepID=UPI0014394A76|nr:septum site-determining protein MinD [Paenibacillus sp. HB172176]